MVNLSNETKKYVLGNIFIEKSLKNNLINYSKLARMIIKDLNLGKKDFDAIVVALRRWSYSQKKNSAQDKNIKTIVKNSHLEIRNKVMVIIIENRNYKHSVNSLYKELKEKSENIQIIEGINAITIITDQDNEKVVLKYFRNEILKKSNNLAALVFRSPESLEDIPGVTAYLSGLLSGNGINIIEMMSCWTDTIFIIKEKDVQKAIGALSEY